MKKKVVIAILAVLVLCSTLFAQNYQIRITYNTNLRASYSTNSRIIETAPSGTVLHVTGSHGRWLQISRNGQQVWMAGWVGLSRIEAPVETPSATSLTATPPPVESSNDPFPITGSTHGVRKVGKALKLLQDKTPKWYDYATEVIERIDIIVNLKLKGRSVVAIAHYPANVISVDRRFSQKTNVDEIASTLVHEACHLHQGKRDRGRGSYTSETTHERECYALEARVLLALNPRKRDIVEKLRCLGREYNQFFRTDWVIKFVCGIGLWDWD